VKPVNSQEIDDLDSGAVLRDAIEVRSKAS
jgi:hypothetical protein